MKPPSSTRMTPAARAWALHQAGELLSAAGTSQKRGCPLVTGCVALTGRQTSPLSSGMGPMGQHALRLSVGEACSGFLCLLSRKLRWGVPIYTRLELGCLAALSMHPFITWKEMGKDAHARCKPAIVGSRPRPLSPTRLSLASQISGSNCRDSCRGLPW